MRRLPRLRNCMSADPSDTLIAAVDLGSNSFRLQICRLLDQTLVPIETLKETIRLGAGLDEHNNLSDSARQQAAEALSRFWRAFAWPAAAAGARGGHQCLPRGAQWC